MASLSHCAAAPAVPTVSPRRHLAENIVCLFHEDRSPVINRPRRGRLPKSIAVLSAACRLRPGAVCEFSAPGHAAMPVKIMEIHDYQYVDVEAIAGHEFIFQDGARSRFARVLSSCLRRSIILDLKHRAALEN